MFKVIIIYEIFFFLFWNVIYFGADLEAFAKSETMKFIYIILSSMALGFVLINTMRFTLGKIPDPRKVIKTKENNFSVLQILGSLFLIFAVADFVLSWMGVNLTPFMGSASRFSPIIFGTIGWFLLNSDKEGEER